MKAADVTADDKARGASKNNDKSKAPRLAETGSMETSELKPGRDAREPGDARELGHARAPGDPRELAIGSNNREGKGTQAEVDDKAVLLGNKLLRRTGGSVVCRTADTAGPPGAMVAARRKLTSSIPRERR